MRRWLKDWDNRAIVAAGILTIFLIGYTYWPVITS